MSDLLIADEVNSALVWAATVHSTEALNRIAQALSMPVQAEAAIAAIWSQWHRRAWQQLVGLRWHFNLGVLVYSLSVLIRYGSGILAGQPSLGPGWWRGRSSPDHLGVWRGTLRD